MVRRRAGNDTFRPNMGVPLGRVGNVESRLSILSNQALDFTYTDAVNEHFQRRRDILARHPEVRTLIAKNPWTALWVVVLVAAQFVIAAYIGATPWWVLLIAAYAVGAVINHA